MAENASADAEIRGFLRDYDSRVVRWTSAVWALGGPAGRRVEAVAAKKDLLGALYQTPHDLTSLVPRFAEDLRLWQEAVDAIAEAGPDDPHRPGLPRLATVASTTARQSLERIERLRRWSWRLAVFISLLAAGWSLSVVFAEALAVGATALLLLITCAVLVYGLGSAYGERRGLELTVLTGAAALIAPGLAGMLAEDGAVDAWGWVLSAGGGVLVVAAGVRFMVLPVDSEPTGRLRHLQRLNDELLPHPAPRGEPADEGTESPNDSGDARTLTRLLDQLDEEVATRERSHRRASRTWQATHVLLASLAALTAGAAGVITQTPSVPQLSATILAASAAALSGLLAALNAGKRQEDNRLTALGAQALRREIRVLREHDIRHDPLVRARIRDALEDLTVRFETILGRPAEPSFWRRHHPEPQSGQ